MKTFCKSLMLIAAAAIAFVSCQKEMENQEIENGLKMKTIKVSTDIATRTTLDSNHENIVWSTGDEISLFNDVNNNNAKLTYSAGGYLEVEVPETTEYIYTHYPYYNGNENGPTSVSVYIAANQTQVSPGQLAGKYFPMVAKGTVSEDNKAIVSFYPVAGALALNIYHTGLSGEETVQSVTVTPTENTSFVGSQIVDLTADEIVYTAPTGNNTSVKVTLTNGLQLSNTAPTDKQKFEGQVYVCLAKQFYKSVKFTIVTDKGSYEITSSATNAFDLVNNDFIPVNINLNKATHNVFSIADGDYVILSYDNKNSKYYAMDTDPNGNSQRRDCTVFSYTGGNSTTTDDPTLVWTISKNNSSYSISGSGMYLSSDNNTAPLSSTAASFIAMSGSTDGTAVIVSEDNRYLKRNQEYGFGFYTSSEDLYIIPVTYTGNPVLSVDTTPIALSASDTEIKSLSISGYLYDTISAGAFVDSDGSSVADWLEVSYADGTVTYSAKEANSSTTAAKEAYIVVTATKGTGSTKKAIKITQAFVPAAASVGDELWAEDFSGFSANDVPESSSSSTIVYGSGSVNYVCVDGGSNTKIFNDALAGGSAPELLVSKSNGSFSVKGIPTGSATVMTLNYAANNNSLAVTSPTTGITLTKIADQVYKIQAQSELSSFDLVFTNASSSNTRLDNISVIVGAPVASISVSTMDATNTLSSDGKSATLNGSVSLINGATISEVSEAGFYYKKESEENYTKVSLSVSSNSFSCPVSDLELNSNYLFYAYAIYASQEISGSVLEFTTSKSSGSTNTIVLTCAQVSSTTSYSPSPLTFTLDGISFGYVNAIINSSNGTPAGWAKNQVIQTKSGGSIYNTSSMGSITKIRVYTVANTNSFSVSSGASPQPTDNSITRPSTPTGTETITYSSYENKTVTEGQSTTANYYDFAINDQPYFKIAPGGSLYIYKIEITYTN